jgi:acyl dehydratase
MLFSVWSASLARVPVDQSFVGRTFPAVSRYEVGAEKIREFADAISDPNPIYRDTAAAQAAGHPRVVAPPTFVTIINLKAIHRIVDEVGLDWSRVVHGEQTFEYHRPVFAGDCLALVATIQNLMTRAGNDFMTVRADISTVEGEPVSTATATIVVRGGE